MTASLSTGQTQAEAGARRRSLQQLAARGLNVLVGVLGTAAARAGLAVLHLAKAAMYVPRHAYPPLQYEYIGRQVWLPRASEQQGAQAGGQAVDPLVPLVAPGRSVFATHRMISYRARMLELHLQI